MNITLVQTTWGRIASHLKLMQAQLLLDGLESNFDIPALGVYLAEFFCRQGRVGADQGHRFVGVVGIILYKYDTNLARTEQTGIDPGRALAIPCS
jgi:hypothetical protein